MALGPTEVQLLVTLAELLQTVLVPPGQPSCGLRHERGLQSICDPADGQQPTGRFLPRFLNQTKVSWFGEFPWLASVRGAPAERADSPLPICGGALVHPSAVLTSAACLQGAELRQFTLTVRLAEFNLGKTVDFGRPASDHAVARVVYHPNFRRVGENDVQNDVALLLLEPPAALGDEVGLACLPDRLQTAEQQAADWERGDCVLHGWTDPRKGTFDSVLHQPVRFVSRDACLTSLRRTQPFRPPLHEGFVCGQTAAGECWADVGSLMACRYPSDRSRWALVGMVPWSRLREPCSEVFRYTNIGRFSSWIEDTVAAHLSAQT
ncbi:phenoloxidase-activating factor 2-like isoform X2 [Pollicipes pollicipes]|nr:phenoloxidase-activating factor 2-like isoform X2 [Pollicipes pollicipes]XP_037087122.1 phenoloxidase-activating factor 2-like isoform X2 [Pollicipes pollicipes]XP_037087123.1 phenoloxidase-activating factor 2-like isoform X2 [Pollicipes pollicipes]XP_037087124.1 phenoloxidase-activating factor 2-like isoform X2 [Pollicipes pollicipes]XP_037087125.1 phenoloxidase-activating factor 2-like isoform X2 [Pollicipes pollicipes]XP_037087126.1 phenoloxidase-activating factor 2-like isoform X2 [Poll